MIWTVPIPRKRLTQLVPAGTRVYHSDLRPLGNLGVTMQAQSSASLALLSAVGGLIAGTAQPEEVRELLRLHHIATARLEFALHSGELPTTLIMHFEKEHLEVHCTEGD